MKKSVTYREITVGIGILVALVIALTLWMRAPGEKVSGSQTMPLLGTPASAKNLFKATVEIFKFQEDFR